MRINVSQFNHFSIFNQTRTLVGTTVMSRLFYTSGMHRYHRLLRPVSAGLVCCSLFILSSCTGSRQAGRTYELTYDLKGAQKPVSAEIDRILDNPVFSPAFVGIEIATADSGAVLYQRYESKLFHPASNMKLLSTAASVRFLGTWFKFTTSVTTDGNVIDSVLHGNICVKGSGDPLMTTAILDSLSISIKGAGIRSITGDLVGDVSAYDSIQWGSGWMWDDEPSTDAAFITPLTINENSIDVVVVPGRKTGDPVRVTTDPPGDYLEIENEAVTSGDTLLPDFTIDRQKGANVVSVKGHLTPGHGELRYSFSIRRPELYFLKLFRASLARQGIEVKGECRLDTIGGSTPLALWESPLDSVLHHINKPSDNLAAENLLKTLGERVKGKPGSSQSGLSAVKEYLALAGADTTSLILADGSGLSFYNAVSPKAIVALLLEQYRHQETFSHFYESLPVAGVDGTLKNRMKGSAAQGNVHAKTGSLTGVSALSGYVTSADGSMLAISMMGNHFPYEIGALRGAQNAIMDLLARSRLRIRK